MPSILDRVRNWLAGTRAPRTMSARAAVLEPRAPASATLRPLHSPASTPAA